MKKKLAHNSKYLILYKLKKSRSDIMIGVASDMTNQKNERTTYSTNKTSYLYYSNFGTMWYNGNPHQYASDYREGDEFALLLDMYKRELEFFINGESKGVFQIKK
jgi:hypothetical protein